MSYKFDKAIGCVQCHQILFFVLYTSMRKTYGELSLVLSVCPGEISVR